MQGIFAEIETSSICQVGSSDNKEKSRKGNKENEEEINVKLDENDLDYLCSFTRFDKTEIKDWFRLNI